MNKQSKNADGLDSILSETLRHLNRLDVIEEAGLLGTMEDDDAQVIADMVSDNRHIQRFIDQHTASSAVALSELAFAIAAAFSSHGNRLSADDVVETINRYVGDQVKELNDSLRDEVRQAIANYVDACVHLIVPVLIEQDV